MDRTKIKTKPKLEDVLFINEECKHKINYDEHVFNKKAHEEPDLPCPKIIEINKEILKNLIIDELKEKYYPGFIKYCKCYSKNCVLKSLKDSQKSVETRVKGNTLLANKEHNMDNHEEIWKLYSKSIALAPLGSKELVLAYECRSNLLLHFKKYEDCVKDIDRALAITEFNLLKVKLLCRKITCFVAMNKDVAEKEELWKILKHHFEKINGAFKDEKFLKMIDQVKNDVLTVPDNQLEDKSKCFTSLTSLANLTLTYNKERRIIADRDFGAGEIILVTKPLIVSHNPNKFYAYCSHCLSFMWAGIPCDQCSLCMYCSENCKEEAWEKYHILECKVSPHVDFSHSIHFRLNKAMKIFLLGVREFGSISKLLEKIENVEQLQNDPNFMKSNTFFDSEFLNFYTLPNTTSHYSCSLSNTVKNTCFLMAYLTQILGNIFEKEIGSMTGKELAKDEDFVYSAVVMLKIITLCEVYMEYPVLRRDPTSPILCPKNRNVAECMKKRCCPAGTIFYFHKGLIEKSCNPNVSVCQTQDGKVIYFSTQPIKKTEMITVMQSVPFYESGRNKRDLFQTIPEVCQCIACKKNWPPVLLEYEKSKAKFNRRSSKIQTKGTKLLQKHIDRLNLKSGNFFEHTVDELQELARDTDVVVSTCGQPSFTSSWMIFFLVGAFKIVYGELPLGHRVPKSC